MYKNDLKPIIIEDYIRHSLSFTSLEGTENYIFEELIPDTKQVIKEIY